MIEDVQTGKSTPSEKTGGEDEEKSAWEKLEIIMDKRANLAVSVFTALVGVFTLITARHIRAGTIRDPIGARGLPNMMGVFLIIGGIILSVQQLLHWSELPGNLVPQEGQEDEKGYPASWIRAIAIILLSMVWAWLLHGLGFLIITPLYLVACGWVMGMRSWKQNVIFSVVYAVSSWLIFGPLFAIRLPLGPLEPFARSLGIIA
jgi:putative tricarboxylic transport membrane protein